MHQIFLILLAQGTELDARSRRAGANLAISILLTIFLYIPGIIHAFWFCFFRGAHV